MKSDKAERVRKALAKARKAATATDTRRDHAAELKALIAGHELTRQEAADLLAVSIHTVDSWLKPPSSTSHNRVSAQTVELLRLKLGAR